MLNNLSKAAGGHFKTVFGAAISVLFVGVILAPLAGLRESASEVDQIPTAVPAKAQMAAREQAQISFARLPLAFEENRGQTDGRVQFLARGPGYTAFLTPGEAVMTLRKSKPRDKAGHQARLRGSRVVPPVSDAAREKPEDGPEPPPVIARLTLEGANLNATAAGVEELPGKVNYFIGNDPTKWRTDIQTWARVKYENVYPGVDLIYYGANGQLEHDFIVRPGAVPSAIRVGFSMDGGEGERHTARVDDNGDLVLGEAGAEIRLKKPFVYQDIGGEKRAIEAAYVLREPLPWPSCDGGTENCKDAKGAKRSARRIGFEIAAYDAARPLVIDPVLVYSTYLGGGGNDLANAIAVDAAGAAYVAGYTYSVNFPVTPGAPQTSFAGSDDVFVAKLSTDGRRLVYSTYLGGSGWDAANSIAGDKTGAAYVAGNTSSSNFPVTVGALQTTHAGGADAFVTKLSATGNSLLYSTYLGSSVQDVAYAIAVDAAGAAYVAGDTYSSNFPITAGALQTKHAGGDSDAFVTKLSATGHSLLYSTYLGGSGWDAANSIAVDKTGAAYVAGYASSANFPITADALQTSMAGWSDAFVTKLSATGNSLLYSTYLGGGGYENANAIAVDAAGAAFVAGITSGSTNFPVTVGALQTTHAGGADAFVTKLSATGNSLLYSTYLGGGDDEYAQAIAVDAAGAAYIAGYTFSTNLPVTVGALQTTAGGSADAFLSKLSANGRSLLYSTYLASSGWDGAFAIAVDAAGTAYMAGYTSSANFLVTPGALQTIMRGGGSDAFITKLAVGVLISSIFPAAAPNTGAQTVTIAGMGFKAGAGVTLKKAGQPDIVGSNVQVGAKGGSLTTSFNLASVAIGAWDVVVANPDGLVATLPAGFTVATPTYPLTVSVTGLGSVSSNPAGINNCAATCSFNFAQSAVTLTATPAAGYSVVWTGCSASSGNSCSLALSAGAIKNVTAAFQSGWSLTPIAPKVKNTAGSLTFTLTRNNGAGAKTLYVSTTQTEGFSNSHDYLPWFNTPVQFADGQTSAPVKITLYNNGISGPTKTFGVIAQAHPTDPPSTWLAKATFTITNSNTKNWWISPLAVAAHEQAGPVVFTIQRASGDGAKTVYVSTADSEDFTNVGNFTPLNQLALSFANGQTVKYVTVAIKDNGIKELNKKFGLIVQEGASDPQNTFVAKATFTVVNDNDVPIPPFQIVNPYLLPSFKTSPTNLQLATYLPNKKARDAAEATGGIAADETSEAIAIYQTSGSDSVIFSASDLGAAFAPYADNFLTHPPTSGSNVLKVSSNNFITVNGKSYAVALVRATGFRPSGLEATHLYVTAQQGSATPRRIPLRVVPPPVILVHGLWGDVGSLSNLLVYLINSPAWQQSPKVFPLAYSNYLPFDADTVNGNLPSGEIAPWDRLDRAIVTMNNMLDREKIVGGRVDVVAHSMGGLVARYYSKKPSYKSWHDRQLGRMRQIITIDTPEIGSPLAKYLVNHANDPIKLAPLDIVHSPILKGMCANVSNPTPLRCLEGKGMLLAPPKLSLGEGAVWALSPESDNMKKIKATNPNIQNSRWLAIVAIKPSDSLLDAIFNALIFGIGRGKIDSVNSILENKRNDGVVTVPSQIAGMTSENIKSNVALFDGLAHTEVPLKLRETIQLDIFTDLANVTNSDIVNATVSCWLRNAGARICR